MALGYKRGLVGQLLSLTGWLIAFVAAFLLFDDVADWLAGLPVFGGTEPAGANTGEAAERSSALLAGAGTYVSRAIAFALLFFGMKLVLSVLGWVLHG